MNGSFLFSVTHAIRLYNSKIQFTSSCNHQIFTLFTHLAVHVDSLSEGLLLISKHLSCVTETDFMAQWQANRHPSLLEVVLLLRPVGHLASQA